MIEDSIRIPLNSIKTEKKDEEEEKNVNYTTALPSHIVINSLDEIYFSGKDQCFIDWQKIHYGIICFCG